MIKNEYKYSKLTGEIIGAAMEVHRFLGNGFQEVIYQRALSHELYLRNIEHKREVEMNVWPLAPICNRCAAKQKRIKQSSFATRHTGYKPARASCL